MGRYVLLEFDDNEAANKFIETMKGAQTGEGTGVDRDMIAGMIAAAHSEVLAVYTKPAGLCACTSALDNSVRGKKFGWWVCPTCKKPKDRRGQTLRNTLNPDLDNTTRVGSPSLSVRWAFKDGRVVTAIES